MYVDNRKATEISRFHVCQLDMILSSLHVKWPTELLLIENSLDQLYLAAP